MVFFYTGQIVTFQLRRARPQRPSHPLCLSPLRVLSWVDYNPRRSNKGIGISNRNSKDAPTILDRYTDRYIIRFRTYASKFLVLKGRLEPRVGCFSLFPTSAPSCAEFGGRQILYQISSFRHILYQTIHVLENNPLMQKSAYRSQKWLGHYI